MRSRFRPRRPDDEGVASTVGTLMALLVFLTFLGLIANQYVPTWMRESEASHTNTALGQFSALKGAVDLQNLAAQTSGSEYVPVTAASAVTLGVDGVPIFGAPTIGSLTADPDAGVTTVEFDYLIRPPSGGDVRTHVAERASGEILLDLLNRYHVPQQVVYQNGAVIRSQHDGQVVRAQPTFLVTETNQTLAVRLDLVSLYGRGGLSGTSTEVVNTRLYATDVQTYLHFPSDAVIWFNHTSRFGLAWYHFLNSTLAQSLNLGGTYTSTPLDQSFTARIGAVIVYHISVSFIPTLDQHVVRLEIWNTPSVMTLDYVWVRHARVQVGVGDVPENALK